MSMHEQFAGMECPHSSRVSGRVGYFGQQPRLALQRPVLDVGMSWGHWGRVEGAREPGFSVGFQGTDTSWHMGFRVGGEHANGEKN